MLYYYYVSVYYTYLLAQSTDTTLNEQYVNGVWQNSSLYISSYNDQCKVSRLLGKMWDANLQSWVNGTLSSNTYDNMGRPFEELLQTWDNNRQQWINSSLTRFDYLENSTSFTSTSLTWDDFGKLWQNNYRYTALFNNAGYSYYFLFEVYMNGSWLPQSRNTTVYDGNNRPLSNKGEYYQNSTWINSNKNAYRYSNNGLHNGAMYYNWNIGSKEWYKTSRQLTNYLPGGMFYKNSVSQSYDYNTNHWVNSGYSVNQYNNDQEVTSFITSFWDTSTEQWVKNSKFRRDYYEDGSIHHFYYELWDIATSAWKPVFRTTYTHNGCNLELNVTGSERTEEINSTGERLFNKDLFVKRMDDIKSGDHSWSYDVQYNSSSRQKSMDNLHFTIKAKPASNTGRTNVAPTTKATLPAHNTTLAIWPNPAKGYIIVTPGTQVQSTVDARLNIYDLSGRLMMTKKLQGTGAQKVVLPAIAKGMYMVTITSVTGTQSMKLIVQ